MARPGISASRKTYLRVYHRLWQRKSRKRPEQKAKDAKYHRDWQKKNKRAYNFRTKCWKAGVKITMAQARKLLNE